MIQVVNLFKHIQLYLIFFTVMFAQNIQADSWVLYTSINYILDLEEDGNFVWAATDGGLVRWDIRDHSHKTWTAADGLSANCVYWISKRPDNTFWCATYNDMYIFDQKDNTFSIVAENLNADSQSFINDQKGGFWYISRNDTSLTHYNNGVTITYNLSDFDNCSSKFYQVQCDNDGAIWVVTDSLIYEKYENNWETLNVVSQLKNRSKKIGIFFDSDNIPWINTYDEIGRLDDGHYNYLTDALSSTTMIVKSANDIWLAGLYTNSLYRFDGSFWTKKHLDVEPGCMDSCYDIIYTESGEIWAASRSGIFIFGESVDDVKTHLYPEDGPQCNLITDIAIRDTGELYCLTWADGLSWFDGGNWYIEWNTWFSGAIGEGFMTMTNDGTLWYLEYKNWAKFRLDKTWQNESELPGWPEPSTVSRINACAAGDDLWICCADTLFRYDWKSMQSYTIEGLRDVYFNAITVAPSGSVWITDRFKYIFHFDGKKWLTWDNLNWNREIWDFASDGNDNLWLRTYYSVYYFDYKSSLLSEIEPPADFPMYSGITCDQWGRLWAGLTGGVAVYENEQWKTFGFLGRECGDIKTTAGELVFAPNGDLWIGTNNGLYRYTPDYDSTEITKESNVPEAITLQNHPNPFNPSTTIEFAMPESGFTNLTIYSISGQKIREITADYLPVGTHTFFWDGKDSIGNDVSSGIYITRLQAGKHTATSRMVLVR